MHQIDQDLPDEKFRELSAWSVAAAGDSALEAWGWSLREDVEAIRTVDLNANSLQAFRDRFPAYMDSDDFTIEFEEFSESSDFIGQD